MKTTEIGAVASDPIFKSGTAVKTLGFDSEDVKSMTTITIVLDDDLTRQVEEAARREHKSVAEWIKDRVRAQGNRTTLLAAMEARASANGYPPGWITLYGSLADDDSLVAPARGGSREVTGLELD